MKVYVVRIQMYFDKWGESTLEESDRVFRNKADAEAYVKKKEKENKNTKSQGTDYYIDEVEMD